MYDGWRHVAKISPFIGIYPYYPLLRKYHPEFEVNFRIKKRRIVDKLNKAVILHFSFIISRLLKTESVPEDQ